MPNSTSLLQALKQVANETAQELKAENERLKASQLSYIEAFIANAKEVEAEARQKNEKSFLYAVSFTVKFAETFLRIMVKK